MSVRGKGLHTDMLTIFKNLHEPGRVRFPRFVVGSVAAEKQQEKRTREIASDTELAADCERYKLEFVEAGHVRVTKDGRLVGRLRRRSPNP
ncbi:MAG: hypothetical protein JSU70_12895 [Phycisphaerales bacterium]|nr:MAG: hypothetical protein JSU70_12895 [Phycisphaerales bacterium]